MKTKRARSSRRRSQSVVPHSVEVLESRKLLTIVVDTLVDEVGDNNTTSLREAIGQAAANPGDDAITFADELSGILDLEFGTLVISDASGDVAIEATPGVNTIDAGGSGSVLFVTSVSKATLTGMTLTGGANFYGGGIHNSGNLTLIGSTVSGNSVSGYGGGIYNRGTLTLSGSTVTNNSAYFSYGYYGYETRLWRRRRDLQPRNSDIDGLDRHGQHSRSIRRRD